MPQMSIALPLLRLMRVYQAMVSIGPLVIVGVGVGVVPPEFEGVEDGGVGGLLVAGAVEQQRVLLESSNYPGWFVHRREGELWVDMSDDSAAFVTASSFQVRSPLAGN